MNDIKSLIKLLLDNYEEDKGRKEKNIDFSSMKIPVGISGRHIHLSEGDLNKLFGEGYKLTPIKALSQPGQFACKEQVTICGPKGVFEKVRIIGPCRKESQVEILQSDAIRLGVKGMIRMSGDLEETPGLTIIGPRGSLVLKKGTIVAQRHIHMNLRQAEGFGLLDGQIVSVMVSGQRGGIMQNMIVRANDKSYLDCHIDIEEANAFGLRNGSTVTIIK